MTTEKPTYTGEKDPFAKYVAKPAISNLGVLAILSGKTKRANQYRPGEWAVRIADQVSSRLGFVLRPRLVHHLLNVLVDRHGGRIRRMSDAEAAEAVVELMESTNLVEKKVSA